MNGTELKMGPDSRYRLVAGDLVISNPVKAKDAGSYQCVATNARGTVVSREASLRFGCKSFLGLQTVAESLFYGCKQNAAIVMLGVNQAV